MKMVRKNIYSYGLKSIRGTLLEYRSHIFKVEYVPTSVADPGCLSRIPDPDFYPSRIPDLGSRIPDPKTATKE
jgi:hypothetical protein